MEAHDYRRHVEHDLAGRQLQDYCDRLNAMNNGRDGWHVVGTAPNRTIAKRNERRDAA